MATLLFSMPLAGQDLTEGVSRELARARAAQISDVHYKLSLELSPDSDHLPGREEITFALSAPASVVLDYRDGEIFNLTVNGAPATRALSNGHILLPQQFLVSGRNRVALNFTSGIATAGRAVTRFVDRDDGAQYIYSLFVPMDASQAFPC